MATTYNCRVNNFLGRDGIGGTAESIVRRNLEVRPGSNYVLPYGHTVWVWPGELISTLEDAGYSGVTVNEIKYSSGVTLTYQDGSTSSGRSLLGINSPLVDYCYDVPSTITVEFEASTGEQTFKRDHTFTINVDYQGDGKIRLEYQFYEVLQAAGFTVYELSSFPPDGQVDLSELPYLDPSVYCEAVSEDGDLVTSSTVIISEDFSSSEINITYNIIDEAEELNSNISNIENVLKEFKIIQDADAAGTLDIELANETLTNLYNEL